MAEAPKAPKIWMNLKIHNYVPLKFYVLGP